MKRKLAKHLLFVGAVGVGLAVWAGLTDELVREHGFRGGVVVGSALIFLVVAFLVSAILELFYCALGE